MKRGATVRAEVRPERENGPRGNPRPPAAPVVVEGAPCANCGDGTSAGSRRPNWCGRSKCLTRDATGRVVE